MRWSNLKLRMSTIRSSLGLRFGFLMLLIIGVTGCWYPLFNLDVAVGEQLARKLGTPVLVMQGDIGGFGPEDLRDAFFVPRRNPATQLSGFLVQSNQFRGNIAEIFFNISEQRFDVFYQQSFPLWQNYSNLSQYLTDYDDTGIILLIQEMNEINARTWAVGAEYFVDDPSPGNIRVAVGFSPDLITDQDRLVGFDLGDTATPPDPPNYQLTMWHQIINSSFILGPPLNSPNTVNFDFLLFGPPTYGFAGYNQITDRYFLSARMENGTQRFFLWNAGTDNLPSILPISKQVTGILSNGNYLAQEDKSITLYSPTGSFLYQINLGTIRFHFERFNIIDSTWYSVFSRVLHGDYELRVEVFEIKTSELRNLAIP
jgi:hypothetical protein